MADENIFRLSDDPELVIRINKYPSGAPGREDPKGFPWRWLLRDM